MKHKHFLQGLFFLGIGALVLALSACPNPVNTDFAVEEGDGEFEISHYKGWGEPVESDFFPSSKYLARALRDFLGWSFTPTAKSEDGRLVVGNAVNEEGYSKGDIRVEPGTKAAVYWIVGRSRRGRDPWISRPKIIGVVDNDSLEGSWRARWRMRWRLNSTYGLLYLDNYSIYLETAASVADLGAKYSYDVTGAIGTAAYVANFQRFRVKSITASLSDANEISSFVFGASENPFDEAVTAEIVGNSITATVPVVSGTPLIPTIEIPDTAEIAPPSGVAQDFTVPVIYTVRAESGLEAVYTVLVIFDPPSSEKAIQSFIFTAADNSGAGITEDVSGEITGTDIAFTVGALVDVANLIPTIDFIGASVSPGSGIANDFTIPVPYTVTAEDNSSVIYNVDVTQEVVPNSPPTVSFPDADYLITGADGNVNGEYLYTGRLNTFGSTATGYYLFYTAYNTGSTTEYYWLIATSTKNTPPDGAAYKHQVADSFSPPADGWLTGGGDAAESVRVEGVPVTSDTSYFGQLPSAGVTLSPVYYYTDPEGDADASTFRWFGWHSASSAFVQIATGPSYTLDGTEGGEIKVEVNAADARGAVGDTVLSSAVSVGGS